MPLVIVLIGVLILLFLMIKLKLDGFISLLLVSIIVGAMMGMNLNDVIETMIEGIGGQLDELVIILGFGAMLGKLLSDSGAAQRIADTLVEKFGQKYIAYALVITAFLIGITLFFEVGFVLLIPIVFTVARQTGMNLLQIGLPMTVALSTTHSFLPPHPGPTAVASTFEASVGITLLYGIIIAIPALIVAGIIWPRMPIIKKMNPVMPEGLVTTKHFTDDEMPSFATSLLVATLPVILIAINAVCELTVATDAFFMPVISFLGNTSVALIITVLLGIYVLGIRKGRTIDDIMKSCKDGVKSIAMIMLVIGAGGAFKEVLVSSGVTEYIEGFATNMEFSPIILAWVIAAILRVALGSATVTVMTASGIVLPIAQASGMSMEIMTLAVTSGSVAFSHVNDPGFWLYKEYFNLSVKDAIKSRTTYTTILAVIGLLGVLALNAVIG